VTDRRSPARLIVLAALVATPLTLFPATVAAHAELETATPADGATVEGTPPEISATFSEALDPERSTLSLRNAAGERLAVGFIDPEDPARMIIDPVPELGPGVYEARWTAKGSDDHLERDTWSFTVTPAPSPSPTPAPTPASSASGEPTPSATAERTPTPALSPSASPGPTDPAASTDGDVILPIVAALAIVLAVGAVLLSRRNRPTTGA
jgi:methionine-rich copper-binding protein CopC